MGMRKRDKLYAALTGDIVSSRKVADRAALQAKLRRLLTRLNKAHSEITAVPLTISGGDEFQGLLRIDVQILALIGELERGLQPVRVRFGIGIGAISTAFARRAQEMDGEAFAFSRAALEQARQAGSPLWFQTTDATFDLAANAISVLVGTVKERWKAVQWRRVDLQRRGWTQERIAKHEGVSQATVSESMQRAGCGAVCKAERNLAALLTRTWDIGP